MHLFEPVIGLLLAGALFVAPTLLDAAYDASPRDLRDNLASVAGLAIVLVLLTAESRVGPAAESAASNA